MSSYNTVQPKRSKRKAASKLIICAAGIFVLLPVLPSFANLSIRLVRQDAETKVWRIDEPPVDQRGPVPIPQVRFIPGDIVSVTAGGCVQTAGSGKTWKRYVDPSGDNSDRLYFGLIDLPGLTSGLEPIRNAIARGPRPVPKPPPGFDLSKFVLQLGYVDDNYRDHGGNGYWGHDDGTENQCRNIGNAWIEVTIRSAPPLSPTLPTAPGPLNTSRAPMDLWWNQIDHNLLAFNPFWQYQKDNHGQSPDPAKLCNNFHDEGDILRLGTPPCTSYKVYVDESDFYKSPAYWAACQAGGEGAGPGTVHGHINWFVVTYTGSVDYENYEGGFKGDGDVDMKLHPPYGVGTTAGRDTIGLEFAARETTDIFFESPWWDTFRDRYASREGSQSVPSMFDRAVVIGLLGIDNKHNPHSEIHPVLGLFGRVSHDETGENWVFFARQRGGEGGCSQDQHGYNAADQSRMTVALTTDGSAPFIRDGDALMKAASDNLLWGQQTVGQQVVLTITFPPTPGTTALAWGEVRVSYGQGRISDNSDRAGASNSRLAQGELRRLRRDPPEQLPRLRVTERAEESRYLGYFLDRLSAQQRTAYYQMVRTQAATELPQVQRRSFSMQRNDSVVRLQARPVSQPDMASVRPVPRQPNHELIALQRLQWQALSRVAGGEQAAMAMMSQMDPPRRPPSQNMPGNQGLGRPRQSAVPASPYGEQRLPGPGPTYERQYPSLLPGPAEQQRFPRP